MSKKLGKKETAKFFTSDDGYVRLNGIKKSKKGPKVVGLASKLAKSGLSAAQVLVMNAARGRDYMKGFGEMTNIKKLENGNIIGWGLPNALNEVHNMAKLAGARSPGLTQKLQDFLKPFDGLIGPDQLVALAEKLPDFADCFVITDTKVTDGKLDLYEPEGSPARCFGLKTIEQTRTFRRVKKDRNGNVISDEEVTVTFKGNKGELPDSFNDAPVPVTA